MRQFKKNLVPIMEASYDSLTSSEKIVADFFIQEDDKTKDFSADIIANELHVSISTLTRFAKKCGFSGYRQFIFEFKMGDKNTSKITDRLIQRVLYDYEELINKTYSLVNEDQFNRITELLIQADRVYIYGKGSSGLVSQEMKLRFMRIGLICEAITDDDMIRMNNVLVDESCLVIGLTVSGETETIIQSLRQSADQGAKTVMLTTNNSKVLADYFDEILLIAQKKTLSYGNQISPQLPLLVMIDIFYAYFMNSDREEKTSLFKHTLDALNVVERDVEE